MPQNISLYNLYQSIDFKDNKPVISVLESAFQHISYFEEKGNNKEAGNSRFVFLGMYSFKGILGELIHKYISGNGKHLQHYLGNVFTNEILARIYDNLKFEKLVKAGSKFEIEKHKHIFTQAYLGFLMQYAENEFVEKQAFSLFLKDIKPISNKKGLNVLQILKAKVELIFKSKIKVLQESHGKGIETTFSTKISISNGEIIGEHTSKSKIYAKNKAIKLAMKNVLEKESQLPIVVKFIENEVEKINQNKLVAKSAIQKQHEQKQAEKKAKRLEIILIKKKLAKEKEIQLSLNKANAKKGREFASKKEKSSKLDEELIEMSAKKRQRIIDKAK